MRMAATARPMAVLLLAAALLLAAPAAAQSSVTDSRTAANGLSLYKIMLTMRWTSMPQNPANAYCDSMEPGSMNPMPFDISYQTQVAELAVQFYVDNELTVNDNMPLGGINNAAVCSDGSCRWYFNEGVFADSMLHFYSGVTTFGTAVPNVYNNWPKDGKEPKVLGDVNGNGRPYMSAQTGIWIAGPFRGDAYVFCCGMYDTSDPLWIEDHKEPPSFPWWAGLLVALGCVIIAIVVIVVCCCCCKNKVEKDKENDLGREAANSVDNPYAIPTQSDVGLSRTPSAVFVGKDADDEAEVDEVYAEGDIVGRSMSGRSFQGAPRMSRAGSMNSGGPMMGPPPMPMGPRMGYPAPPMPPPGQPNMGFGYM